MTHDLTMVRMEAFRTSAPELQRLTMRPPEPFKVTMWMFGANRQNGVTPEETLADIRRVLNSAKTD